MQIEVRPKKLFPSEIAFLVLKLGKILKQEKVGETLKSRRHSEHPAFTQYLPRLCASLAVCSAIEILPTYINHIKDKHNKCKALSTITISLMGM